MKTIEQIIRDDIGQGGPQLPSDDYEQRIDSILGQMNCAELLTRISNAVAEIGGGSGMRLVYSGPVSALRSSMKEALPATVFYTNYRGETSERTITPIRPWFGSTEWHPEPQWLLRAYDHDKGAERDFALKDFGGRVLSAASEQSLEGILRELDEIERKVWAWSGSAFLNNELKGAEDADCKTQLYSELCGIGNAMHWLRTKICVLSFPGHAEAGKVHEYVQGYEFRADNGGGYTPTDGERAMIEDAIQGFIADAGQVEGNGWLPMTHPDLPLNGASVVMFDSFAPGKDGFGQVVARFDKTHGWHASASVVGGKYITLTNPIKWRPLFSAPASEGAE